jgi:putative glutamine amidotransferase
MKPRVAIPLPHGADPEYALHAIPQYEHAVEFSGGDPVRIPLDRTPSEVMKMIEHCDAVVLPGSKADVDPAKFAAPRHPKTEAADRLRDMVDELLLQDAYNMRKPVLGICYGLQILNVYRSGSLLQHIESAVNHEAGRQVPVAHEVAIEPDSLLANVMVKSHEDSELATTMSRALLDRTLRLRSGQACEVGRSPKDSAQILIPVNSSHHQAAGDIIGDGLRVVARCPEDGIIEALESDDPDHFIVAVQWHPERSFDDDPHSRAIFSALIEAARQRHRELVGEFEST